MIFELLLVLGDFDHWLFSPGANIITFIKVGPSVAAVKEYLSSHLFAKTA